MCEQIVMYDDEDRVQLSNYQNATVKNAVMSLKISRSDSIKKSETKELKEVFTTVM